MRYTPSEVSPSPPNPAEPGVWLLCVRIPRINEQRGGGRSKRARVSSYPLYSETVEGTFVFLGNTLSLPLGHKVIRNIGGRVG